MEDSTKPAVFLECPLSFSYWGGDGAEISGSEAKGRLETEDLILLPISGQLLTIPYRTIFSIQETDYRFVLAFSSREKLEVFYLGYQYENFLKKLCHLRNEILLKDMLMQESLIKGGLHGEFAWNNSAGELLLKGEAEPRLYETALVLLPERSDPIRLLYSELLEIRDQDYELTLKTERGDWLILRQMGTNREPFKKALRDAMNALEAKTQSLLKEIFPKADGSLLRRAGNIMKEGRAASKKELDALNPELWTVLETRLELVERQVSAVPAREDSNEEMELEP
jgi:hypothetical protein